MDQEIRAAVDRLRTPGEGLWYVARCERLRLRPAELERALAATGLPFRIVGKPPAPALSIIVGPLQRRAGNVEFEYSLELRLSALCDVVFARSTICTANLAADRCGHPFLVWSRLEAPIEPFSIALAAVEQAGWRSISEEQSFEHIRGCRSRLAACSVARSTATGR